MNLVLFQIFFQGRSTLTQLTSENQTFALRDTGEFHGVEEKVCYYFNVGDFSYRKIYSGLL